MALYKCTYYYYSDQKFRILLIETDASTTIVHTFLEEGGALLYDTLQDVEGHRFNQAPFL